MVQMVEGLLPIHSRVLFELFKIPINMVDFSSVPESLVIFNPLQFPPKLYELWIILHFEGDSMVRLISC